METLPVFTPNLLGLLQILVVVVLPLVVAFVTKRSLSPQVKGSVLALLAGVSSVLVSWAAAVTSNVVFDWRTVVLNAVVVWALAVATHVGLWKGSVTQEKLLDTGVRD